MLTNKANPLTQRYKHLLKEFKKIFDDREIGIAASVDIQGAFDNTAYNKINEALTERNLDLETCVWIDKMLRNREITSCPLV